MQCVNSIHCCSVTDRTCDLHNQRPKARGCKIHQQIYMHCTSGISIYMLLKSKVYMDLCNKSHMHTFITVMCTHSRYMPRYKSVTYTVYGCRACKNPCRLIHVYYQISSYYVVFFFTSWYIQGWFRLHSFFINYILILATKQGILEG